MHCTCASVTQVLVRAGVNCTGVLVLACACACTCVTLVLAGIYCAAIIIAAAACALAACALSFVVVLDVLPQDVKAVGLSRELRGDGGARCQALFLDDFCRAGRVVRRLGSDVQGAQEVVALRSVIRE